MVDDVAIVTASVIGSESKKEDRTYIWIIIGVVGGAVVAAGVIVFIVFYHRYRRRQQQQDTVEGRVRDNLLQTRS